MQAADQDQPAERRTAAWRPWAFAIIGLILLVFVLLNSQEVEIDFLIGTATAPLIFALAIAGVLGFAVGWLAARMRRRPERE